MQVIEASGKSVQEAKEAAARQLGASPDSLKVTVLEESKGLFGKSTVRIRAEISEQEPAPAPKAKAVAEKPPVKAKAPEPEPEPEPAPEPVQAVVAEVPPAEEVAPRVAERSGEAPQSEATQEDADRMLQLVVGILEAGQLEVSAQVTGISGRYINVELDGKDAAFLVGKHGEVLNALQYVVNIIANQQYGTGIRATLDGNNYRHRREEALTKLAQRIAEQVAERGEEAVLDALPAFERRIVHKALGEQPGVTTYSEGEEPNRRVVIAPAD